MRVDQLAEACMDVCAERRQYVQVLAIEPRKQAIANQAMPEVCGQQAESSPVGSQSEGKLKAGDATFKAGRLGDKKIVGDNVMLGDALIFTKDNIDQFDF